jgi:hypothetical protein
MYSTNKTKVSVYTDFGYKIIYVIGHILSSPLVDLEYEKSSKF